MKGKGKNITVLCVISVLVIYYYNIFIRVMYDFILKWEDWIREVLNDYFI